MKLAIKINECIELLKSYGIRDRSGLVARKVPVKGKYGYFMRTVYVRPELIHNPKRNNTQKQKEEYYEDLPKLLDEISRFTFDGKNEDEVFEMTRKMGKANSLAFKGKKFHTEEENSINQKIYDIKEKYCEDLAEYYVNNKLNCKHLIVEHEKNQWKASVLYIRDSKTGIQLSFHGYENKRNVNIEITHNSDVWDGVKNAFEYTESEYKEAVKNKHLVDEFYKDYVNYANDYFNKKLNGMIQILVKSKRFDKLIQEDIKKGTIKGKDDLDVGVYLDIDTPDDFSDVFADDYMNYVEKSKLKLKVNIKDSNKTLSYNGLENIKKYITVELGKKEIFLKKFFEENFEEMERNFILDENS